MPITLTCSSCTATLRVDEQQAGRRVRCPKCQEVITVPGATDDLGRQSVRDDYAADDRVTSRPPRQEYVEDDESEGRPIRRGRDRRYDEEEEAGKGVGKLGSLAQAARGKHLKTLRVVLCIIGGL